MDRQEINILINYVDNNREHLNTLEHEFIASLKKNYNATGVLTKRQVEFLYDVKDYIQSMVSEKAVFKSESEIYAAQYSSFDHLTPFNL
jgi:hypothetical protein